ncbi:MAG TPA: hypothetical protein VMZ31_12220 [Phycisphaerae bacterium]|nr:hypothetical protein [Phycisphaerae bacterium]
MPAKLALRLKPGTDPGKVDPYLIQLMMSANMMLGAIRWSDSLGDKEGQPKSVSAQSDLFISLTVTMGWAGETVKLIHEGKRNKGLTDQMVADDPKLRNIWKECATKIRCACRKNPVFHPRLQRCVDVRDQCFAHWDAVVAEGVIEQLRQMPNLPPLWECDDQSGSYRDSRFRWADEALVRYILRCREDAELSAEVKEIREVVTDLVELTNCLVGALLKKQGVPVEVVEGDS